MRAVPLFGGALWLMIAGAAAAETASPAVVSRDDAEVRAGPNENPQLYVTNRLKRGSPVQVVEEVGNGWLKIQPPAGSFSWISTNAVQQISPNQPNWMVVAHPDVRVPVIVGTDFPKEVASQIEGCRLARGAQVKCLGPAHMDEEGLWLRIEPPPGEYRFIRVDAVTRSDGSSIVRAAVPAARSAPSPVPPGCRRRKPKRSGSTPPTPSAPVTPPWPSTFTTAPRPPLSRTIPNWRCKRRIVPTGWAKRAPQSIRRSPRRR